MNQDQIISETRQKLGASVTHFADELKKLRTGRAHANMLEGVTVEVYGTEMPLIQLATVSAPEAQLLQITPFDPNNLQAISSAIRDNQSLGLNPADDGRIVRIQIPPLTSERREQIVKQLHQKLESSLIAMRAVRHDALKAAEELKQSKAMSEDDYKRFEKQVDEVMTSRKSEVEHMTKAKETAIMSV